MQMDTHQFMSYLTKYHCFILVLSILLLFVSSPDEKEGFYFRLITGNKNPVDYNDMNFTSIIVTRLFPMNNTLHRHYPGVVTRKEVTFCVCVLVQCQIVKVHPCFWTNTGKEVSSG